MTGTESSKRWLGICYALTIFVSAFLLFQVQPLVSKFILPWFGGTPAVWTTCMLFFQMVLFAGYTYAHVLSRRSPRAQAIIQIVLILIAALMPITPGASWKPTGEEQPTLQIITLLAASVGLPFFVLSSTGPLLQSWFSRTHEGSSPYRLYALSNLGSLLALVTYPFVFEPSFDLPIQAKLWSVGFVVYALGCATCAMAVRKVPSIEATLDSTAAGAVIEKPSVMQGVLWFLLPMAASVMLLATTNQVCMDLASVPFLWVVPLALYLLSFILCFDSDRWYSRWAFSIAMVGSIATVCKVMHLGVNAKMFVQIFVYFSSLFFCAMFCHGELVKLKPHPRYLTVFYLMISAGGAAGGLFVGLVCPYVFNEFIELPIGMLLCIVLLFVVFWRDGVRHLLANRGVLLECWAPLLDSILIIAGLFWLAERGLEDLEKNPIGWVLYVLVVAGLFGVVIWRHVIGKKHAVLEGWLPLVTSTAAIVGLLWLAKFYGLDELHRSKEGVVSVSRNFYGVLRVKDNGLENPKLYEGYRYLSLTHGRILHGVQYYSEEKRQFPTTYYVEHSGAGIMLKWRNRSIDIYDDEQEVVDGVTLEDHEDRPRDKPIRVGIVGLGTGTVAHYAVKGDTFCFYDINPRVVELANSEFTYLKGARERGAEVRIEPGDARLTMERQEPQDYDVIILDAFSSDAIPVHLLTVEAFEIYRKHLKPDGVLAVHISNRYFDLCPVVEGNAEKLGLAAVDIVYGVPKKDKWKNRFDDEFERSDSDWVLVSPSPIVLGYNDEAGKDIDPSYQAVRSAIHDAVTKMWVHDERITRGFPLEVAKDDPKPTTPPKKIVWTDTRNNLLEVMLDDPPHIEVWNLLKQKWKELTADKPKETDHSENVEESAPPETNTEGGEPDTSTEDGSS